MKGEIKEICRLVTFGLMMSLGAFLTVQTLGYPFSVCVIAGAVGSAIGVGVASWAFKKG